MANLSRDQELVKRLKRRFIWYLFHDWNEQYDEQGRLLRLDLDRLKLTHLPPELWQFASLHTLDLNNNQLSSLPAALFQLVNLHTLGLSGNQLSNLPAALFQLTNLHKLHLNRNQLSSLSAELGQLANLHTLYLNDNRLSSLPAELGQLVNLHTLGLSGNQLNSLPAELGQLANLHTLYLNNNQLNSLPAELGQLTHLQSLGLGGNQLSNLPAALFQLANLRLLGLGGNRLSSLPAELFQLANLRWLDLSGNPQLQIPPPEVVDQGTSAVLAYLHALPQAVERFEAKLLLVGEGGMGKSSLLRALDQLPFVPGLPLTHGIAVGTLQLPHPEAGKPPLTISTWDFGGQEIYQATHQVFLTRRSVYLLVWNARQGPDVCRLRFWLDTISTLAPDAKILLVATHADEWQPQLDVQRYQQDYPQLAGHCIVSNQDGRGLDELRQAVAAIAAQTPLVGERWPRDWVEIERELLARPEHHLDLAVFLQICARHQIGSSDATQVLGPVLHDLGKILFFRDDPLLNQLVVLKPNWISRAISCVLDDSQVRQAGGLLTHRELSRIWATDEQGQPYPPALYPVFLRLMERFDLCYHLEPERPGQPVTHSLLPLLLSEKRPPSLPTPPSVGSADLARVEMRYTLGFVPTGLMSWLLVRTHRYSQQLHWREGAHLAYHSQQAHLELDPHRREISLIVWGAFPYTFFTILKETLDTLLERFQGLSIRREVPCLCPQQRAHPHWHDFGLLESQFQNGVTEIVCQSGTRLSLLTLLYGMRTDAPDRVAVALQQTQKLVAQTAPMSAEEQQRRFDMIQQSQEFLWHALLRLTNFEMQKEQTPCPSLFLLEREAEQSFNPKDWMSRAYRLRLLCQYPAGPHLITGEPGYPLREGKDWWKTMSPWLHRLVTVLKTGVPLGKAVGEVFDQVDTERLAHQIDLFNEILTDLPGIDAVDAVSETGGNGHLSVEQRLEGAALRVLFYFLDTADPAHHWHGLVKVPTPDGTILWVCEQHKRELA